MYVNGKMVSAKTIPHMGAREVKNSNSRGVHSSMTYLLYYKNFCKYYYVPLPSTIQKKGKVDK
jgi:hypothetical protein